MYRICIAKAEEEKPYQCASGFYLRVGANSQKLRTSEIKNIIAASQSFFDSRENQIADIERDFSRAAYDKYRRLCDIPIIRNYEEVLEGLSVVRLSKKDKNIKFTNAGVLLFCKSPREFIPESYLTVVRYGGADRFSIADRQDFTGDVIEQLDQGLSFIKRNIKVEYEIT